MQRRGLVDGKPVQAPPPPLPLGNFITGLPMAALLSGSLVILDVVCCFFIVILVRYKYRIRLK